MTYNALSQLSEDGYLHRRVVACAASVNIPDPDQWATQHRWELALQPEWASRYIKSVSPTPGSDEDSITDQMILSAVQDLNAAP